MVTNWKICSIKLLQIAYVEKKILIMSHYMVEKKNYSAYKVQKWLVYDIYFQFALAENCICTSKEVKFNSTIIVC